MRHTFERNMETIKNFVLLGGSGSGKSEIALNLAAALARRKKEQIHFFDLDQTKPLFRARDVCAHQSQKHVVHHFQEQFYDAPTQVGGLIPLLIEPESYVVMDVGGNEIGARLVGGYAQCLNNANTSVWYVVNPYRPWNENVEEIDKTMSSILRAARIRRFHIICNPNLGCETTREDVLNGLAEARKLIEPYMPVEMLCCKESLWKAVHPLCKLPVFPLQLYLNDLYE